MLSYKSNYVAQVDKMDCGVATIQVEESEIVAALVEFFECLVLALALQEELMEIMKWGLFVFSLTIVFTLLGIRKLMGEIDE